MRATWDRLRDSHVSEHWRVAVKKLLIVRQTSRVASTSHELKRTAKKTSGA